MFGRLFTIGSAALLFASACSSTQPQEKEPMGVLPSAVTTAEPLWIPYGIQAGHSVEADPRERRLDGLRQITFDGASGHAVWHPDSKQLLYTSGRSKQSCGQLFRIRLEDGRTAPVSPPGGWSASGGFAPKKGRGADVVFSFSESSKPPCPPIGGALSWSLPSCNIYLGGQTLLAGTREGSAAGAPAPFIESKGYNGAVAVSRDGMVAFTSTRDGDPELYIAEPDGSNVRRLTTSRGYDGQAQFSPDGSKLVWQSERAGAVAADRGGTTIAPKRLNITIAGFEGQHPRALTDHDALHITPSFLPDSRRVLYASDYDAAAAGPTRNFEIYLIDPDGPLTASKGPASERITHRAGFDGEASISPDGRYIVFSSSRYADAPDETNLFVARWVPNDD